MKRVTIISEVLRIGNLTWHFEKKMIEIEWALKSLDDKQQTSLVDIDPPPRTHISPGKSMVGRWHFVPFKEMLSFNGVSRYFFWGGYTIPHMRDSLKDISVKLPNSMLLCLVLDFHAGRVAFIPPPLPVVNLFELPPCLILVPRCGPWRGHVGDRWTSSFLGKVRWQWRDQSSYTCEKRGYFLLVNFRCFKFVSDVFLLDLLVSFSLDEVLYSSVRNTWWERV